MRKGILKSITNMYHIMGGRQIADMNCMIEYETFNHRCQDARADIVAPSMRSICGGQEGTEICTPDRERLRASRNQHSGQSPHWSHDDRI